MDELFDYELNDDGLMLYVECHYAWWMCSLDNGLIHWVDSLCLVWFFWDTLLCWYLFLLPVWTSFSLWLWLTYSCACMSYSLMVGIWNMEEERTIQLNLALKKVGIENKPSVHKNLIYGLNGEWLIILMKLTSTMGLSTKFSWRGI